MLEGIYEKKTWPDMTITHPVCYGQASSNNPEFSVPSFSARPTFTHLSQTPSANSQLSNKFSPIHFRPTRETKGGEKRKKSGILTAVQSRWGWRCYFFTPIWEERNLSPFLSSHASVSFFPSAIISSSFPSCHPETHQMSEDSMLSQSVGSICIFKYIFVVWPISLRSSGRGQHFYTEPWWDHLVRIWWKCPRRCHTLSPSLVLYSSQLTKALQKKTLHRLLCVIES